MPATFTVWVLSSNRPGKIDIPSHVGIWYTFLVQQGADGQTAWTSKKHSFTGIQTTAPDFVKNIVIQAVLHDGSTRNVYQIPTWDGISIFPGLFEDNTQTVNVAGNYELNRLNINDVRGMKVVANWDIIHGGAGQDISPEFNVSAMNTRLINEHNIDIENNDIYIKAMNVKAEWTIASQSTMVYNAYGVTTYISWLGLDYDVVSK